jgi:hypothetical protein
VRPRRPSSGPDRGRRRGKRRQAPQRRTSAAPAQSTAARWPRRRCLVRTAREKRHRTHKAYHESTGRAPRHRSGFTTTHRWSFSPRQVPSYPVMMRVLAVVAFTALLGACATLSGAADLHVDESVDAAPHQSSTSSSSTSSSAGPPDSSSSASDGGPPDSSSGDGPYSSPTDATVSPCANLAGVWAFAGQCLQTTRCTATQNLCAINIVCPAESFSGTATNQNASFSSGVRTCTGSLSGTTVSGTCDDHGFSCTFTATTGK